MNEFLKIGNASSVVFDNIPAIETAAWRAWIIGLCKNGDARVVSLFGKELADKSVRLFAILGVDSKGELLISSTTLKDKKYPSITKDLLQAHLFERELYEGLGVEPKGHPWLKPVRKFDEYNYYSVSGNAIHEVAVGPVHAGVIEPGHFRFQCHGEKVFNLEIRLGYQHRGIEDLMLGASPSKRLALAESIAGDTVIGHGLAYCHTIEGLADRQVTQRVRIIRAVALELERVANHIGDIGAIANDVGFLPVASYSGPLRADFLNMLMLISGNRTGRGLLKPGGVAFDIDEEMSSKILSKVETAKKRSEGLIDMLLSNLVALSRFKQTGVVKTDMAKELGLVGVAARACDLLRDVRVQYPSGIFRSKKIMPAKATTGDVFARIRVRHLEIKRSLEFICELMMALPHDKIYSPVEKLKENSFTVCMVEGWRGEIVHAAMTDAAGKIVCYKIIDPSFHNWPGLEMALRDGQISDFPLCNKSFNLSYAGYDL